jgi:hypothetical protein
VLVYDDFRNDNEGTMRRVMRFLGVDDSVPVQAMDVHPAMRMRSVRVRAFARRLTLAEGPVTRAVNTTVKAMVPTQLRRDVRRRVVFGKPHAPDEEFMLELRRRFKGEVEALGEYLDRDLVGLWGYDELG